MSWEEAGVRLVENLVTLIRGRGAREGDALVGMAPEGLRILLEDGLASGGYGETDPDRWLAGFNITMTWRNTYAQGLGVNLSTMDVRVLDEPMGADALVLWAAPEKRTARPAPITGGDGGDAG